MLPAALLLCFLALVPGDRAPAAEEPLPRCGYPQLPSCEVAEAVSWQLWDWAQAEIQSAIDGGADYGAASEALAPMRADSYTWWHASLLQDPRLSDADRREFRRRLLAAIGEAKFRRGELPDMAPWAK